MQSVYQLLRQPYRWFATATRIDQMGADTPPDKPSLRQQKRQLAQRCQQARAAIDEPVRSAAVECVVKDLLGWLTEISAKKIALYLSIGAEFPTRKLAQTLLGEGYSLYAPVIHPQEKEMSFYPLCDFDQLSNGPLADIPQPPEQGDATPIQDFDVIILPVVGFSQSGDRLGQGAGYYDRCLASLFTNPPTRPVHLIGLAFSAQQLETIPTEAHDVRINGVFTENGRYFFNDHTPTLPHAT